uniref:NADH-ubiquinone oxidoreductase chain 1 n=1 Tax=Tropostreptus microcephalus TaxID=2931683 RepID=A0A8T9JCM9_9MYRI|nr:NADH dehydrogenase subunit 1 [Tropostreptus microcephalus]UOF70373.1 NADH dehydrogenase subunit 1 [Tropostreptus microcephalus]
MIFTVNFLFLVVMVLVSVAFITLFERKVLGYIQIRKGPNKVSLIGVLQPFADAVKLFTKSLSHPFHMNYYVYYLSPTIMLFVMMLSWVIYPLLLGLFDYEYGILFFLCCTSFSVYTLFGSGWSSNSKYALLGALRGVAQTISYEVSIALILLGVVIMSLSYDLTIIMSHQHTVWFVLLLLPLFYIWFISGLAELNRTPFDFAEGESELVSGFNVEYSGGGFALLFMAEYGGILFISLLTGILFFGGGLVGLGMGLVMSFMVIWVRGVLPRFRYDKLMFLAWKSFLPISLNYILLCFCVVMYFN